jgi:hypothetical protein
VQTVLKVSMSVIGHIDAEWLRSKVAGRQVPARATLRMLPVCRVEEARRARFLGAVAQACSVDSP